MYAVGRKEHGKEEKLERGEGGVCCDKERGSRPWREDGLPQLLEKGRHDLCVRGRMCESKCECEWVVVTSVVERIDSSVLVVCRYLAERVTVLCLYRPTPRYGCLTDWTLGSFAIWYNRQTEM